MSHSGNARAFIKRHWWYDAPAWRVQVFDGDEWAGIHIVPDWGDAIDLGNRAVARVRRAKAEASEGVTG